MNLKRRILPGYPNFFGWPDLIKRNSGKADGFVARRADCCAFTKHLPMM